MKPYGCPTVFAGREMMQDILADLVKNRSCRNGSTKNQQRVSKLCPKLGYRLRWTAELERVACRHEDALSSAPLLARLAPIQQFPRLVSISKKGAARRQRSNDNIGMVLGAFPGFPERGAQSWGPFLDSLQVRSQEPWPKQRDGTSYGTLRSL